MDVLEYLQIRNEISEYFYSPEAYYRKTEFDKLDSKHQQVVLSYANLVYERAKLLEPAVSKDLYTLVEDGVSNLVSFEHRLKTIEGLKRKIIADSKDYDGSYYRASHNLCDSLRYTFVIEDDLYVEKTDEYLHKLEEYGYEVIDFKNAWNLDSYKGFNVRIVNKNKKDIFELQFHTPFGYEIKEGHTRDLYTVIRDPNAPLDLKIKANTLRKLFQSTVKVPLNAKEYVYNPLVKGGKYGKK